VETHQLDFFVIRKFYWLLGPECRDSSACQILSKSVNRLPDIVKGLSISCKDIKVFQFFKMAAVCHLRLVWGIFGPPTVSTWGLCHSAKLDYD